MFNAAIEYAIHNLAKLKNSTQPLKISDLASGDGFSLEYLRKIFQRLEKAGLVKTAPGPAGGVALSRPAAKIGLDQIIQAVRGKSPWGCGRHCPQWCRGRDCQIKKIMRKAEEILMEFMAEKKLSDFAS